MITSIKSPKEQKKEHIYRNLKQLCKAVFRNKKIVIGITGGAFDLFHFGHLNYLKNASEKCDILIVHIDGNELVSKRKGKGRPIIEERKRANIVSSLKFVDYVYISNNIFYGNKIINSIKPNIVFKIRRDKSRDNEFTSAFKKRFPKIQTIFLKSVSGISTGLLIDNISNPMSKNKKLSSKETEGLNKAKNVARHFYSYSGFKIGAAVITNNEIFTGSNISNASPVSASCAESNAISKAVNSGLKSIDKILIYAPYTTTFTPCGSCRQIISEFSNNKNPTEIILVNKKNEVKRTSIDKLLPLPFKSVRKYN